MKGKKKHLPKWLAVIFLLILCWMALGASIQIILGTIALYINEEYAYNINLMIQQNMPFVVGSVLGYVFICFLLYKGIKYLWNYTKMSAILKSVFKEVKRLNKEVKEEAENK